VNKLKNAIHWLASKRSNKFFSSLLGLASLFFFSTGDMDDAIFYMALAIWIEPKGDA